MDLITKPLITCLLTAILGLFSLSAGSLPPYPEEHSNATVVPTPWRPWIVRNNNTNVCILAKFGAVLRVNTTKTQKNFTVDQMSAQVGNGSHCGSDLQVLELVFDGISLSFSFKKSAKEIIVSEIVFDSGTDRIVNNEILFKTPEDFGYKCFNNQTIKLSPTLDMTLMNVRLEAFRSGNYLQNYTDWEQWERVGLKCHLDRISSDAWQISGISVGVGVTVLAFITLVAVWSGSRQERVMLKVKLMRQWTVEENMAWSERISAVQKKGNGVKKESRANSPINTGIVNPNYADSESEKF